MNSRMKYALAILLLLIVRDVSAQVGSKFDTITEAQALAHHIEWITVTETINREGACASSTNLLYKTRFSKTGRIIERYHLLQPQSFREYDADGKPIRILYADTAGKPYESFTMAYDAAGNCVAVVDSALSLGFIASRTEIKWNASGAKTEESKYVSGQLFSRGRWNYAADGKLRSAAWYANRTEWLYDSLQHVSEQRFYNESIQVHSVKKIIYDSAYRIAQTSDSVSNGIPVRHYYQYDSIGLRFIFDEKHDTVFDRNTLNLLLKDAPDMRPNPDPVPMSPAPQSLPDKPKRNRRNDLPKTSSEIIEGKYRRTVHYYFAYYSG